MNVKFCNNLKEARRIKKLTQKKTAQLLGVAEYCYANWEQGRAEPSTQDLELICIILDVTADYLLGLEDEDGMKIQIHNSFNNNGNINNLQIGNNNKANKH